MLEFKYDNAKNQLRCIFEGHLDSEHCTALSKTIEAELLKLSVENLKIVFDLAKTEYISSSFIRVVLKSAKPLKRGDFSIINTNAFIRETIRTSGLEQLISDTGAEIESAQHESVKFEPASDFSKTALISSSNEYHDLYRQSIDNPEQFWATQAKKHLTWFKEWDNVCEWQSPDAKWFQGGKLNVSYNCLDRHLDTPIADKTAIIWESEPTDEKGNPSETRKLTYKEMYNATNRFANVLKLNGIRKGERVIIYMPMIPEAIIAMLACARIGAIHSVIFGGFSAQAIAERVRDSEAKLIITADGGFRRGAIAPLKKNVDESFLLKDTDGRPLCDSIEKTIVFRRTGHDINMKEGRDLWWDDEIKKAEADCQAEEMDSEDPLFILYTSGSTGKPKGIYHSSAGYLLGVKLSHKYVFDIQENDIYWCTADIGWITGHSYIVYGPMANGSTIVMYEGAPNFPEKDRYWQIVERHRVTVFYTAPTAIRSFMQWGEEWPAKHDLSSLRLLGTVGEPINPHAWLWYHKIIGGGRCPIVDTWWQTETGSIMITTLPGAMACKPGSAGIPFFGVQPEVVTDDGKPIHTNSGGKLVLRKPWPSMLRGVWGDRERFAWTYWTDVPGSYFTGDGARKDKDGYFWIMGRIDDVINVSGHRIGTAEVESALVSHPAVAEAAVVGRPDDIKGSGLVAFVSLRDNAKPDDSLRDQLRTHVGKELGPVSKPDEIRFVHAMPKTRSGKIMRRLLKQIAAGVEISGDVTTLEDFNILAQLSSDEG